MRSPVCLSACVSPANNFQLVDFHEILQGGRAIEGDFDAILFNHIASTILKCRRFKLLIWLQNLHQSALTIKVKFGSIVGLHRNP
jgi:hypothetical protein